MNKLELAKDVISEIKTKSNSFARKNNFGKATKLVKGENDFEIVNSTQFGYRKYTTGEYVPNAYMNKFGWKNCYYQNAECVIAIPAILFAKLEKWESFIRKADQSLSMV